MGHCSKESRKRPLKPGSNGTRIALRRPSYLATLQKPQTLLQSTAPAQDKGRLPFFSIIPYPDCPAHSLEDKEKQFRFGSGCTLPRCCAQLACNSIETESCSRPMASPTP